MTNFSDLLLPPWLLLLSLISAYALFYLVHRRSATTNKHKKSKSFNFIDWTTELLLASPTNTAMLPLGAAVLTANPSNVEHILKTRFDNYPKGQGTTAVLADVLGDGIFNSDGEHWRLQRKTAALEFTTKTIRTVVMATVTDELSRRLLSFLSRAATSGRVFDLQDVLDRFSFDNVCRVAFDVDPARLSSGGEDDDCARFALAFEAVVDVAIRRFRRPAFVWRLCSLLRIGEEGKLKKELRIVNEFAMKIVKERKQRKSSITSENNDLLSGFIKENDFSDEFLRDMVISFVLAGRDTTSTALSWFFYAVSSHTEVQDKILQEIQRVREKHGSSAGEILSFDEIREMDYLHAAVTEALRLYPVVPLLSRTAAAADVLVDGTRVRQNQTVMLSIHAMGRMKSIWGDDCDEFRPERWLNSSGEFQARSPYNFMVFNAGPRMCLGREMAYTQMKTVAAVVMERFVVELATRDGDEGEHETLFLLRFKGGLLVRVREREREKQGEYVSKLH